MKQRKFNRGLGLPPTGGGVLLGTPASRERKNLPAWRVEGGGRVGGGLRVEGLRRTSRATAGIPLPNRLPKLVMRTRKWIHAFPFTNWRETPVGKPSLSPLCSSSERGEAVAILNERNAIYAAPTKVKASNTSLLSSMNTVAPPTNNPSDDHPTAIPAISGIVPRRPCWEPWAAQRTLFGPGVKHIGTMKARVARSNPVSKIFPLLRRVDRPCSMPGRYRTTSPRRPQSLSSS